MEEDLSFYTMLSLRDMAIRGFVVSLWKHSDILCRFHNRVIPPSLLTIREIEIEIADKMYKLRCPESLKKEIKTFVTAIGMQIENWISFHQSYLENQDCCQLLAKYSIDPNVKLYVPILKKLCFTDMGTIDYRKTAKELIHCKMFDVVKLYKLACLYCLEDCIPLLWQELPWEIKRMFKKEGQFRIKNSFDLQYCWPFILNGKLSKLDSISSLCSGYLTTFYSHALKYTLQDGNIAAAKYFLGQLTPEEKKIFLSTMELHLVDAEDGKFLGNPAFTRGIFSSDNKAELLCHLFSQMNHEQRIQIFDDQRWIIFSYFLNWPWQDLCLRLAHAFRAFLSEEDYEYLLVEMYEFSTGSEYSYGKLFRDFFPRCSETFRSEFVTSRLLSGPFISDIFNTEDSESAKVLFKNVTAELRMKFVSSKHFFEFLHHYILLNKLNMVKLCLQEAKLSKECRTTLKVAFEVFGAANRDQIKLQAQVQRQFFQLLDRIYFNNKRHLEGETLYNTKMLCSNDFKTL